MDLPDQTSTPIRWPSADPVNPDAPDPKRPKIIQIAINPEGDSAYSVLFVLRDRLAVAAYGQQLFKPSMDPS